jgi:FixJ family two-component response regulator
METAGARQYGNKMSARSLVAVVDDDDSIRESLPDVLRGFGFDVEAFASAEEFLAVGALHSAHCLILDIAMPGVSGPALQRVLVNCGVRIPIVFITGHADEGMRRRLLDVGAVDVLDKPFTEAALLHALTVALGGSRRPEETMQPSASADRFANQPVVFVVDDDVSVREAIELIVVAAGWRGELCASATEFLERPQPSAPSCLVLDVNLPDLNGLDLQQRVADGRDKMPIIMITGYGDIPMTVKAMKAGAVEFLTKPFDGDALLVAMQSAIARSETTLKRAVALHDLKEAYASLSRREREVMQLVVTGNLNKQVAAALGISEITVKAHRGRMMRKMHADSLAQLVKLGAELDLPKPEPTRFRETKQ